MSVARGLVLAGLSTTPACQSSEVAVGDEVIDPAGVWYWGDLHAHSGWSYDGCESPQHDCATVSSGPASRFFQVAAEGGLDFAAITDHAEADLFFPDGLDAPSLDIWSGQEAVVEAAEDGPVLPILGLEWTGFRGDELDGRPRGSHRTILFERPDVCEELRVPGHRFTDGLHEVEHGTSVFEQTRAGAVAERPTDLWADLDRGVEACGPVRWVSFAHHSAYQVPQETDWLLHENAPLREDVVEVYSEHGSSECADLDADGCGWAVDEDAGYYPDGSVQTALSRGFTLGFVGGSDSHDARPGSIEDGPGPVAQWTDTDDDGIGDELQYHYTGGGLTGVLTDQDLSVGAIFDAIDGRHTIASSGPRPDLGVFAEGQDGVEYPFGSVIPGDALPLSIRAWVPEVDGAQIRIERIERRGSSAEVVEAMDGSGFSGTWAPQQAGWTYLRVRLLYDDGTEDRLWVSPWFAETPEGCGCATGGAGGGLAGLAAVLLAFLRRRAAPLKAS